jgi:glycosyltransferase involved in cell wall biosynthesis
MKTIVISAVNLNVGGTLTILRDCLQYLSTLTEKGDYRIVALVYNKELAFYPNIEYIEIRWAKKLWPLRLWCEYITMRGISKRLAPVFLWLSLHDTTPNVIAEHRAVYCHNSYPFYRWKMRELFFSPKVVLFSLFSKYAYRINIYRNDYIVVQQEWLRREFVNWFHLDGERIIVTPPEYTAPSMETRERSDEEARGDSLCEFSFIYAASPNSHKNFECLCAAAKLLQSQMPDNSFKVYITVKGDENNYAKWLHKQWGKIPSIHFIGFQSRDDLYVYYQKSDCLVFPSKVETWGLPITEFAGFEKPMLLADLPYAHETAAGCKQVAYFDPDDPSKLANLMEKLVRGEEDFLMEVKRRHISEPIAFSWKDLFSILSNTIKQ